MPQTILRMLLFLVVSLSACTTNKRVSEATATQPRLLAAPQVVHRDSLTLFDEARQRMIPVALYLPAGYPRAPLKVAILNHGYGGQNTAYSFIARQLVAQGYFVASIQHELPGDAPMPLTGNPYEVRMPHWRRGVESIRFVLAALQRTRPELDYTRLLLLGHSNGGDMVMLLAQEQPALVHDVISLDNRRVPLPRTRQPRVLSLRSSDQPADAGVLPTPQEQAAWGIRVVSLPNTHHNDMWDGATESQQREMLGHIKAFLAAGSRQ